MKIITSLLTISAVALLAACGGGDSKSDIKSDAPAAKRVALTPEAKMIDNYLVSMDKIADAIENVDDEASARNAASKIAAIQEEMEKLTEEFEGSEMNQQRAYMAMMSGPRRNEMIQTQTRISTSMMKLMTQPELISIIQEEMEKIPQPGG